MTHPYLDNVKFSTMQNETRPRKFVDQRIFLGLEALGTYDPKNDHTHAVKVNEAELSDDQKWNIFMNLLEQASYCHPKCPKNIRSLYRKRFY